MSRYVVLLKHIMYDVPEYENRLEATLSISRRAVFFKSEYMKRREPELIIRNI